LARAAVPALLYCVQNNAAFAALRFLTPPLYQLLSNLKIVATAVLSCVVLNRVFSRLQVEHVSEGLAAFAGLADALRPPQWLGVALLALASALPGLATCLSSSSGSAGGTGLTSHALLSGSAIMACVALSSGA
jgi:drug/metabolite transporter (DMT)-like permease